MTMSHDKFNQFLSKCAKDENLKSEFVKDPETVLKANGLNPDDIPDNVAEKMSAAGWGEIGNALLGELISIGKDALGKGINAAGQAATDSLDELNKNIK